MYHDFIQSPIGNLELVASDKGLRQIILHKNGVITEQPSGDHPILKAASHQLQAYFKKELSTFDLPFDFDGATEFEKSVWQILLTIPFGKTITYSDIAHRINNPKSVRAVGTANGRNPIPIIVPCHRVIGKDGSLTGFSLGLDIKKALLRLENPKRFVEQGRLF